MLLITVHGVVLEWMQEVATTENYKNPHIEVAPYVPPDSDPNVWEDAPEYQPVGEADLEKGGRASESDESETEKAAVEDHQPSVADVGGENRSDAKDVEVKGGGNIGEGLAPAGEPAPGKTEVAHEGVPPEIKAEVLAMLGSMEKFAAVRLEEGEEPQEDDEDEED